jgi:predicted PurR-regulated permease PerM
MSLHAAGSGGAPKTPEKLEKSAIPKLINRVDASVTKPDAEPPHPKLPTPRELTAISLLVLAIISTCAALYFAKAFFLPITTALIIGTMLAPWAAVLEKQKIPRTLAAVLVVAVSAGLVIVMIGLMTAPAMQWVDRLPELGELLRAKLQLFERPLRWVSGVTHLFGGNEKGAPFQLPQIAWVQPTLEFLTPTLTEILVFFVTLVLFLASWPDLRRALVLNFEHHDARLRALRILNAIEQSLGSYLFTVTLINFAVGIVTGLICAATGNPNPAGLGALAAILNYIPIIGPVATFLVLVGVGVMSFETLGGALFAPLLFAGFTFIEGHFLTPAIIGRRLALNAFAVFLALTFWTWLWGPMGAFISSPLLIVCLIVKEHLFPADAPQMPDATKTK